MKKKNQNNRNVVTTARLVFKELNNRMLKRLIWPLFAFAVIGVNSANSATLVVAGGELQGATGVVVGGLGVYDVSFRDGTCALVHGHACDGSLGPYPFTFSGSSSGEANANAGLASAALMDQVFLGPFDDDPTLTRGLEEPGLGVVWRIYTASYQSGANAYVGCAMNSSNEGLDSSVGPGDCGYWPDGNDLTDHSFATWAVWAPTGQPIPGSHTGANVDVPEINGSQLGIGLTLLLSLVLLYREREGFQA